MRSSYTFLNTLTSVNSLIIKSITRQKLHHVNYSGGKQKQKFLIADYGICDHDIRKENQINSVVHTKRCGGFPN